MNSDHYRRQCDGHRKKIADLQKRKSDESRKVADSRSKASKAVASASTTKNSSTVQMYLRQAEGHEKNAQSAEKKAAEYEAKIAKEHADLARAEEHLGRAQIDEEKKRTRDQEQRATEAERRMRSIATKLTSHDALHRDAQAKLQQLQQLPESVSVLFMASNPLDQNELRLDEEVRAIGEMIRRSRHRDSVRLESRWALRPGDILQAMNEVKPAIVHFSGHGSDKDELVLQNDLGKTKLVSKEAIVQVMAAGSDALQMVFFNTCYSRNQAEAVVEHVSAAIGMRTTIGDEAARVFSAQFYSAIGFGLSVKRAFDQAKAALMLESIPEESTPELFVQAGLDADEIVIVRPGDEPASPKVPTFRP